MHTNSRHIMSLILGFSAAVFPCLGTAQNVRETRDVPESTISTHTACKSRLFPRRPTLRISQYRSAIDCLLARPGSWRAYPLRGLVRFVAPDGAIRV